MEVADLFVEHGLSRVGTRRPESRRVSPVVLLGLTGLLLLAAGATASAAERWRLCSVPLDMPLDDREALDNQALEGLYQGDYGHDMPHNYGGYIAGNLKDSVLDEWPFYHIKTTLKDGRLLQLWFSSSADGRKVFGVHLELPWSDKPKRGFKAERDAVEAAFGASDLELSPPGAPAQKLLVIADRTMAKDRYASVVARLPKLDQISHDDADRFWKLDLQEVARLLGPDFRGAIVILNSQGDKLVSEQAELIDLSRARSVFNLGSAK